MKKICGFFVGFVAVAHIGVAGAVTIKKAAPVAVQKSTAMESTGSLMPTVMNLISGISEISKKQKELTAECIPSSQEVNFVNELLKEWAKVGETTSDEFFRSLGVSKCSTPTGEYASKVQAFGADGDNDLICYDYFGGKGNEGMIWEGFPMAAATYYCTDGSLSSCSEKNKKHVTNMYDIFNKIGFTESDFVGAEEMKMAAQLIDKVEKCSYARLSAQKKAMWASYLTETIGNVGQKTNTGSIMDVVGSVANTGGGAGNVLNSLGGIATQFLVGQ